MNKNELDKLIKNKEFLQNKIKEFLKERIVRKQKLDENEILGHLEKSAHNLMFIKDNIKLGYFDWCITGCYYAVYHAALSLILKKGYSSKNHYATLCILIQEYYKNGIEEDDIKLMEKFFIDYQDLLFYVESKNKRENATYSSKMMFDKSTVEDLRLKSILFIDKAKQILENNN